MLKTAQSQYDYVCPACGDYVLQELLEEFKSAVRMACRLCGVTYGVKREVCDEQ
jgi:uncharacterized Zn finger protein